MHNLNTPVQSIGNLEHVFSLFYELKQEYPFLDERYLMNVINELTGWHYSADKKNEMKEMLLRLLLIPG